MSDAAKTISYGRFTMLDARGPSTPVPGPDRRTTGLAENERFTMLPDSERLYDAIDEPDNRFDLLPSTIPGAGQGVFARMDLPAGVVFQVIGVFVRRESVADRCTHFADCHKFRVGDKLLIPMGFGGLVNHSVNPNLEKVIDGDRVFLRALRSIAAGEELFFRYPDSALDRLGIG